MAHINWFLTGAGNSNIQPEDNNCRGGGRTVDLGVPIGMDVHDLRSLENMLRHQRYEDCCLRDELSETEHSSSDESSGDESSQVEIRELGSF